MSLQAHRALKRRGAINNLLLSLYFCSELDFEDNHSDTTWPSCSAFTSM